MPDTPEKPDATDQPTPSTSAVPESGGSADTPKEADGANGAKEESNDAGPKKRGSKSRKKAPAKLEVPADEALSNETVSDEKDEPSVTGVAPSVSEPEAKTDAEASEPEHPSKPEDDDTSAARETLSSGTPPPPAASKKTGRGWMGIAGLAVVLLGGGAAYFTYPWGGALNPAGDPAVLAAISDKVSALDARVRKLETAVPAGTTDTAAVSDLQSKLATLEKELAELAARPTLPAQPEATGEDPATPAPSEAADPRLAAALDMVASLEARVDQLDAGGTDVLQQRLGAIETLIADTDAAGRLDSVEGTLSDAAKQGDVASLESRITALESGNDAQLMRAASLAMAAANLSRAATGSDPFQHELTVIRALAPNQAQLNALSAHAKTGLPTVASLRAEFPAFGRAAIRADRLAGATGWWESLLANLQSMITVRNTEETDGDTTIDLVGRMENYLLDGQLTAALTTADRLSPAAQEAMASWLAQAKPRAELQAAIADLNESVLAAIAASGGGD